jgi:hypothetical protein
LNRRLSYLEQLVAAAVLLALVAFSLIRVQIVDVPWHLATARLARALGHWPTRNTFSYTFPDHPIFQQYPAFQATLYALYQRWGWGALSVLTCAGWSAVFLMFVRWAGPWRAAAARPLLWAVGLYALQRRMVLRPDLFSMLSLGAMLLALEAYRGRRRWAIAAVPVIHLFWANSHQLFPLSLVIQALFVAHLMLARRGWWAVARTDAAVPIWPAAIALLISIGLCFATPLGLDVVRVSAQTAESLSLMRDQVQEFRRIWQQPYELALAAATGLPAAWILWRGRRLWSPFDVGLWLMSAALMLSAVRGLMFFGIISVAIAQRAILRCEAAGLEIFPAVRPIVGRILRIEATILAVALSASVVHKRWIDPPLALGGTQPGLGRSLGGWADDAIAFLRANPPPGRMMNMAWSSGNALIWDLPEQPVFVDPRFESYPHAFLREVADAYRDDGRLDALIDRYRPSWIFGEHFRDGVRDRLVTLVRRGWAPVYLDSAHVILVRPGADTEAYRAAHRVDLASARPGDLMAGPPELRAEQLAQFRQFLQALGF